MVSPKIAKPIPPVAGWEKNCYEKEKLSLKELATFKYR
jgi:hypothetical protein